MSSAFRTLKELHDQEHETEDDERSLRSLYYSAQEGTGTLSSRTSSLNTLHFVKEEEDDDEDGEDGEDGEVTTVPSLERIPSVPSLGELSLSEGDMDFSKKQECAYREEEETSGLIEAAGAVEQVSSEPSSPAPLALAPRPSGRCRAHAPAFTPLSHSAASGGPSGPLPCSARGRGRQGT